MPKSYDPDGWRTVDPVVLARMAEQKRERNRIAAERSEASRKARNDAAQRDRDARELLERAKNLGAKWLDVEMNDSCVTCWLPIIPPHFFYWLLTTNPARWLRPHDLDSHLSDEQQERNAATRKRWRRMAPAKFGLTQKEISKVERRQWPESGRRGPKRTPEAAIIMVFDAALRGTGVVTSPTNRRVAASRRYLAYKMALFCLPSKRARPLLRREAAKYVLDLLEDKNLQRDRLYYAQNQFESRFSPAEAK